MSFSTACRLAKLPRCQLASATSASRNTSGHLTWPLL